MDSAGLQTFLTVARLGSFSEAAEILYLTQPAVSKRIAALESEVKTRLFDRLGRQVLLTEAGRLLATRAQTILNEIEDSRREIQNLSANISGKLSIGTSHHIGLHRLPSVLQNYTTQFPEVELDLHFKNSEQICDAIKNGELELGIITLPLLPIEQLTSRRIWDDELVFVLGRNHPLVKEKTMTALNPSNMQCSLKQLADHLAILPSRGTFTREIVEHVFAQDKLTISTKMETNYLETIKMLVSVGLGWSVLPKTMFPQTTDTQSRFSLTKLDEDVLITQVPNIHIRRQLGAIWHSSRTLSNAAKQLLVELGKNRDL